MSFGMRLVLCAAVASVAIGCNRADEPDNRPADTRPPVSAPAATPPAIPPAGPTGEVRSMGGELGAVDSENRTFVVTANGQDRTFRFSEATQVTGASGTQGLAGRRGARVTVYFRDDAGSPIADRIILSNTDAPAAPSR